MIHRLIRRFIIILVGVFCTALIFAQEFHVSTVSEFRQALISAAGNGSADSIILESGIYQTCADGNGEFKFEDSEPYGISIIGAEENTILDGCGSSRVFSYNMSTVGSPILSATNLVFSNGLTTYSNPDGAALKADRSVDVVDCTFLNNEAYGDGGAIFSQNGNLSILRSTISNNKASGNGGAIFIQNDHLSILRSTINNNKARSGAGVYGYTNLLVVASKLKNNIASSSGGAIYIENNDVSIFNSIIAFNEANGGSAIYLSGNYESDNNIQILRSIVYDNPGAINLDFMGGAVILYGNVFAMNSPYNFDYPSNKSRLVFGYNLLDEIAILDVFRNRQIENLNNFQISEAELNKVNFLNNDFEIDETSSLIDKGIPYNELYSQISSQRNYWWTESLYYFNEIQADLSGNPIFFGETQDIGPYELDYSNSPNLMKPYVSNIVLLNGSSVVKTGVSTTVNILASARTAETLTGYYIDIDSKGYEEVTSSFNYTFDKWSTPISAFVIDSNGLKSDEKTFYIYSQELSLEEKIFNLDSGWHHMGTGSEITDFLVFNTAEIVWYFDSGVWKFYSPDEDIKNTIMNQGYSEFDIIPRNTGFWIKIK